MKVFGVKQLTLKINFKMKNLINKLLKPFNAEIHGKGYIQSLQKGEFRKDAFDCQAEILQSSKVTHIFDIGANRGQVTELYLNKFPKATIHAFEPFDESFNYLQNRFKDNKRVVLNKLAVSNSNEPLSFFVNENVDTNSLLNSNETGLSSDKQVKNKETIIVNCVTLNDYVKNNNIDCIDILKMDIQGGEYNALLGANYLLQNKLIKLIYTEAFFVEQYKEVPLFYDIAKLLLQHNYPLHDIFNPYYGDNKMAWCDAIFIAK